MPVCPHCQTRTEEAYSPCPTGDGFFTVDWDADGNLIFIRFDGTLIT